MFKNILASGTGVTQSTDVRLIDDPDALEFGDTPSYL